MDSEFLGRQHKAIVNMLKDLQKFGKNKEEHASSVEDANILKKTLDDLWDLTYLRDTLRNQAKLYPQNKEIHYAHSLVTVLCIKLGI